MKLLFFWAVNSYTSMELILDGKFINQAYETYNCVFKTINSGTYSYGNETLSFINEGLQEPWLFLSKNFNYNFIGVSWTDLKMSLETTQFNQYTPDKIQQLWNQLIQNPQMTIVGCDKSNFFVASFSLLLQIFEANVYIRYILLAIAVLDFLLIIQQYDEYGTLLLDLDKKYNGNFVNGDKEETGPLKIFFTMPRLVILFFSPYFFFFFKSSKEIAQLSSIDNKYGLFKKNFFSKEESFCYNYGYEVLKILIGFPVTLNALIINFELLKEEYSFGLTVVIFFSLFSLILSLVSPLFLKSCDGSLRVYQFSLFLAIIRLILIRFIIDFFLFN
jgi:hypothetical protein